MSGERHMSRTRSGERASFSESVRWPGVPTGVRGKTGTETPGDSCARTRALKRTRQFANLTKNGKDASERASRFSQERERESPHLGAARKL